MSISRARRPLLVIAAVLVAVAALAVSFTHTPTARAAAATNANPWAMQMSVPTQDGLVITGVAGSSSQALLVKDYLNQPIFTVSQAGGAAVMGDDLRVLDGSDIFHGQITISPDNPNSAVCVRNGQLWIGGPGGGIWRCANLGGGFGWWPVV